MSQPDQIKVGSCLCGAVRYRVNGPLRSVIGCHCGQCRKQTGNYLSATGASLANFELIEDRGLRWYEASARAKRGFCHQCGSTLFWQAHGADEIAIAAGSIDGPTGLETVAHVHIAYRGDYYELDENLPQHPKGGAGIPTPG
jgi:hypothetical protein